jgi:hypothetical protein
VGDPVFASSGRREREAANQALFREINNQLRDLHPAESIEVAEFLCECGAGGCMTTIAVPLAKYAEIRANPLLFITIAGHHDPALERVVEDHDSWTVVEAFGKAADQLT